MQDFEFKLSEMFVGVISEVRTLSDATQTYRINAVSIISDIRSCLYGVICATSNRTPPPRLGSLKSFYSTMLAYMPAMPIFFRERQLVGKADDCSGGGVKVLG